MCVMLLGKDTCFKYHKPKSVSKNRRTWSCSRINVARSWPKLLAPSATTTFLLLSPWTWARINSYSSRSRPSSVNRSKSGDLGHKGVCGGPQQWLGVSAGPSSGRTRRQAALRPTTAEGGSGGGTQGEARRLSGRSPPGAKPPKPGFGVALGQGGPRHAHPKKSPLKNT